MFKKFKHVTGMYLVVILSIYLLYDELEVVETSDLRNCDELSPVKVDLYDIDNPIIVRNDHQIKFSASVQVNNYRIPDSLITDVELQRRIGLWIPVPCPSCSGTWKGEEFQLIRTVSDMCDNCNVTVRDLKVRLPWNVDTIIPRWLSATLEGSYWAKIKLNDAFNPSQTVACVEMYLNLST